MRHRIAKKKSRSIPLINVLWGTPLYLLDIDVKNIPNLILSEKFEVKEGNSTYYIPIKDFKIGFQFDDVGDYKLSVIDEFRRKGAAFLERDLHQHFLIEDPLDFLSIFYMYTLDDVLWNLFIESAKGKRPAEFLAYLILKTQMNPENKIDEQKINFLASEFGCEPNEYAIVCKMEEIKKNFFNLHAARRELNIQISGCSIFPFYDFQSKEVIKRLMGLSTYEALAINFLDYLSDFLAFANLVEKDKVDLKLGLYKNKKDGKNYVAFREGNRMVYFETLLKNNNSYSYRFTEVEEPKKFSEEVPLKFSTVVYMMQEPLGLLDPPLKKTQERNSRMPDVYECMTAWFKNYSKVFNKVYNNYSNVIDDSLSENNLASFFEDLGVSYWFRNLEEMKECSSKLLKLRAKFQEQLL